MRKRITKYLLWVIFLTHTSVLVPGMKGLLGKEVKMASDDLAEKLKMGSIKLVGLSVVIGTVSYLVCGSFALHVMYSIIRMFRQF